MKWDFWRKGKSLKQLEPHALAFVMVQNVLERKFPFNKWRGDGEPIPEHADAFVEMSVNIYQLSIFLDFLERKFGSHVSGIVKSHIVTLMSKGKYSGVSGQLFEAVQLGRALPEREHFFAGKPSYQIDCNVAGAFLKVASEPEKEKIALYALLGQSLTLGRISAESAFGGLIEQIEFRPETIVGLSRPEDIHVEWSEACGCFERQLQRRHNNPLFPREKRTVITAELIEARSQDLYDLLQLQQDSKRFLEEFTAEANSTTTFGELRKIRDTVEELIIRCAGIGDLARTQQQSLRAMYESIVASMRDACPEEQKAQLELALAGSDSHQKTFANHFVAQSSRKDTPIYSDGLLASLLVEDVETVRIMAILIPENNRVALAKAAVYLIEDARKEGYAVSQATEKLKALEQNST